MSRRNRLVLPEVPLHIIQRGNNRLPCFFAEADYLVYLDMLGIAAKLAGCRIHAYVLMTNHVHLLVSPMYEGSPAIMMKALGERYVKYVNRRHDRMGTLWQGRYRSCLVQEERYLFTCQRYIELNPVRAQMVMHPKITAGQVIRRTRLASMTNSLRPMHCTKRWVPSNQNGNCGIAHCLKTNFPLRKSSTFAKPQTETLFSVTKPLSSALPSQWGQT